jgi:hypothetical protein
LFLVLAAGKNKTDLRAIAVRNFCSTVIVSREVEGLNAIVLNVGQGIINEALLDEKSAIRIQSLWRGGLTRMQMKILKEESRSACLIQR